MKIKWNMVYFPFGEWIGESGNKVDIDGNFKASTDKEPVLVVMTNSHCGASHGEPATKSKTPSYFNPDTLAEIKGVEWIYVDGGDSFYE
jgi:hypothetical protein